MSHHGPNPNNPEMAESLRREMERLKREMCNNVWPDGMMRNDDEGIVPMAIGIEKGRVMIQFPEPTAWVGMTPEQAVIVAELLISKAREAGFSGMVSVTL